MVKYLRRRDKVTGQWVGDPTRMTSWKAWGRNPAQFLNDDRSLTNAKGVNAGVIRAYFNKTGWDRYETVIVDEVL